MAPTHSGLPQFWLRNFHNMAIMAAVIRVPYTCQMISETELLGALHRYWGYKSFRPMQQKIVRSLLGAGTAAW